MFEGEDVETHALSVSGSPQGAWRLTEADKSRRVAAPSLWIDGQPAQVGLATGAPGMVQRVRSAVPTRADGDHR
jgi:hypothetical protein